MQNTTRGLLLITAVSIVVKGELANENLSNDTKTKAYVPICVRSLNYQKKAVPVKFEQVPEAAVQRCSSKHVHVQNRSS